MVQYADGAVEVEFKVPDWCQEARFGVKEVIACKSRITVDSEGKNIHSRETRKTHIWLLAVPLDPARELRGIRLSNNSCIHVFALTLAQ